jgi:hypothetical protein
LLNFLELYHGLLVASQLLAEVSLPILTFSHLLLLMCVSHGYLIDCPYHNACLKVCIVRPLNYLVLLFILIFHSEVLIWIFFSRIRHVEKDVIGICSAQVIKKVEDGAYCAEGTSSGEGFATSITGYELGVLATVSDGETIRWGPVLIFVRVRILRSLLPPNLFQKSLGFNLLLVV